jgi:hypothetical protein
MVEEASRIGEVIEACSTNFIAQCYELYQLPPLGGLVKTREKTGRSEIEIYGVVYNALTSGVEPGRRPIARGKDEMNEDEIYRANPQLLKLLRSEFTIQITGFRQDGRCYQYLPPKPAHIHSFVYLCSDQEVKQFSQSFGFLNILLKSHLPLPVEELVAASLRQMGQVYGAERRSFLVEAGKELAVLLSSDYGQLKAILKGLDYDAGK